MNKPASKPHAMRGAMKACGALMAAIAVALVLVFGWNWWTVLLAIILLACPVAIVWTALRFGHDNEFPVDPSSKRNKP